MKDVIVEDTAIQNIPVLPLERAKYIEINGYKTYYKDEGSGSAILFLHSISGTSFIWDKWTNYLKQNYRVIRLELPSFEQHESNNFSTEFYINFIEEFANAMGLNSFYLCGHSTGGQLAYEIAHKLPKRITALVLVAPSGFSPINSKLIKATYRLTLKVFGKRYIKWFTSRYLLKKKLKQLYFNSEMVTEQLTDKYLENLFSKENRETYPNYINGIHPINLSIDGISEIDTPTLILWGESDKILPVSDARKFKTIITNIRLITYPKAGHFPFDEVADLSYKDLVRFLEDHKSYS
ncbi:MAG: alpha/beta hydrolase [Bacteroidota bacterium]